MKLFILLLLLLPCCVNAQTEAVKIITAGTVVSVILQEDISSKTSDEGKIIHFLTSQPIISGDRVLVPAGAIVTGTITESEKAKGLGKAGKLSFTIDWLSVGEKKIKLTGEQKANGKQKTGTAVAEAVLLTPLFLLKKGKNKKFDKGQLFQVYVDNDTTL